ncbi:hypothetical protein E2562_034171 [Oryza meyeriana var. granulata]|uniref:Uncharacterized protein n=1 Tax=Oryza meyeriana var. granulata TaxID=110450 RepID=A0A6G1ESC7_9ORYZ|nr:hypothetical protein E2562_034170 [Oryza meyeriana var. granulata]KAF0927532.1 hypothetical protein E2562_034171 [Oryza meyeriana var. granulata]
MRFQPAQRLATEPEQARAKSLCALEATVGHYFARPGDRPDDAWWEPSAKSLSLQAKPRGKRDEPCDGRTERDDSGKGRSKTKSFLLLARSPDLAATAQPVHPQGASRSHTPSASKAPSR